MKQNICFLLFIFTSLQAQAIGKWNPEWSACKIDSDCVQVESCCSWMAINKNWAKEVKAHEDKYCSLVECAAPGHRFPLVSCVNQTCKAESFKTRK